MNLSTSTSERALRAARTEEITRRLGAGLPHHEDRELRDELVTLHLAVADSVASRYSRRGLSAEDLRQVARLGLVQAARRFDATAGHDFMSFCVPTIRGEVCRHFRDQGWMVRPPRRVQELQQRLGPVEQQLAQDLGRPPTTAELATALGTDDAEVTEAQSALGCFTPASLDRPVSERSDLPLSATLAVADAGPDRVEARVTLAPIVRHLSDRDRRILGLRFFAGLSQREIAQDLGVTQMQVSRHLTRILRDLGERIGVAATSPPARAGVP